MRLDANPRVPTSSNDGNGNPGNSGNGSINGVAGNGEQGHYAVAICHAARSPESPYVVVTVAAARISRLMSAIGNGHGRHTGAVFDPAVNRSGDNWGDIIPPVTNPRTGAVAFPGLNVRYLDWIGRGCTAPAAMTNNGAAAGTTDANSSSGTGASSGTASSGTGNAAPGTVPRPNANPNAAAPGTVSGATVPGSTSSGNGLPVQAAVPASVPAGGGSSVPDSGLPSWALVLMLLAVMAAGASGLGVAMTRDGAHRAR